MVFVGDGYVPVNTQLRSRPDPLLLDWRLQTVEGWDARRHGNNKTRVQRKSQFKHAQQPCDSPSPQQRTKCILFLSSIHLMTKYFLELSSPLMNKYITPTDLLKLFSNYQMNNYFWYNPHSPWWKILFNKLLHSPYEQITFWFLLNNLEQTSFNILNYPV